MPFPPSACAHARIRSTAIVLRDAGQVPEGVALTVACAECGVMFQFAGVETTSTVLVSEDRTEIRLVIETTKGPHPEG